VPNEVVLSKCLRGDIILIFDVLVFGGGVLGDLADKLRLLSIAMLVN
jgi:hypothetical protein